jgi:hypothetical protein
MSEQAKFGQGMDAALEFMYKEAKTGPVPGMADMIAHFLLQAPDQFQRIAQAKELLTLYMEEHLILRDPEFAIPQAHMSVVLKPQRIRIRGFIDLLHQGGTPRLPTTVCDFKCPKSAGSQSKADSSLQLTLYCAAAGTSEAELVEFNVRKPKSKNFEVAIQPLVTKVTEDRVVRTALYLSGLEDDLKARLKSGIWPRLGDPSRYPCNQCSFFDACWKEHKEIIGEAPPGS